MTEWNWQGGRLVNGEVSLSIGEAFDLQLKDASVAMACKGKIKRNTAIVRKFINETMANLIEMGALRFHLNKRIFAK